MCNKVIYFTGMNFIMNFHDGSQFVRNCVLHYKGGHQRAVDDIDPNKWSFLATGILKDISDFDPSKDRLWGYRKDEDN